MTISVKFLPWLVTLTSTYPPLVGGLCPSSGRTPVWGSAGSRWLSWVGVWRSSLTVSLRCYEHCSGPLLLQKKSNLKKKRSNFYSKVSLLFLKLFIQIQGYKPLFSKLEIIVAHSLIKTTQFKLEMNGIWPCLYNHNYQLHKIICIF